MREEQEKEEWERCRCNWFAWKWMYSDLYAVNGDVDDEAIIKLTGGRKEPKKLNCVCALLQSAGHLRSRDAHTSLSLKLLASHFAASSSLQPFVPLSNGWRERESHFVCAASAKMGIPLGKSSPLQLINSFDAPIREDWFAGPLTKYFVREWVSESESESTFAPVEQCKWPVDCRKECTFTLSLSPPSLHRLVKRQTELESVDAVIDTLHWLNEWLNSLRK